MGLPAEMLINVAEALRGVVYDGPAASITSEQLNVNVLRLVDGASIPQHVNNEVDVLVVVIQGTCKLFVDNEMTVLRPGMAAVIPRGRVRALRCTMGPLAYLTCHQRRAPLMPTLPSKKAAEAF
ncbi:cupin domain-containing protein [Oscillochloris sp. ZM17-4]|uniref:cupin domain-containing protein n=1 Tax=Oscillochloris sp. ZM17-4 TaxID=2866714 RepID=UPI001C737097|nr:cupin domain-containing protein [Oscillochloris sp. ZM17-4]MBX0327984.1 cupin domain-containing protein [Oscillochloris sp. ZM17-4]